MNVDDFVKVVLVLGFTFSMVGISFQIMRLIGKFTASLQDLRKTFQNVSTVSDMAVEDYSKLRGLLNGILGAFDNIQNVLSPLSVVTNMLSKFGPKKPEASEEEPEVSEK